VSYQIKQGSTECPLVFLMVGSSDHITGLTGATPTVAISKAAAAFTTPDGDVKEVGNGWYQVQGNATDTSTLGPLILHATATSADPTDAVYEVVGYDPQVPSSPALIATAVWTDLLTSSDFATTGSVGHDIAQGVMVGSYTAGANPGMLVWDAQQATFNSAGTMGGSLLTASTYGIPLGQPISNFPFTMVSPTTGALMTGLVITSMVSLDGAAFVSTVNQATEIGSGEYKIDLASADLNGSTVALQFSAVGAETTVITIITQPA
jgi:hypothetical protein